MRFLRVVLVSVPRHCVSSRAVGLYRQAPTVMRLHSPWAYDIQSVKKVHGVEKRPNFYYRPKFSSPQYSAAFVTWMVTEYKKDQEFFTKARTASRGGQKK
jgi:hypothetical protein